MKRRKGNEKEEEEGEGGRGMRRRKGNEKEEGK